jgi:DNA-binding transcriptional LysR family regulator
MFEWGDLRIFLAIVRYRSLSAAGRALQIQQSTVGRRLATLEGALDASLFEHTSLGYRLTRAGVDLLAHAEKIEDEVMSAERALLGRDSRVSGVVRMTAPLAFGEGFVVPILAQFHKAEPEITMELVADNAELSIVNREADIALRLGRPKQSLLVARRVGQVMNGLYASDEYLRRKSNPVAGRLQNHEVIDFDETYRNKQAVAWFRERARGGRLAIRLNGSHGIAVAASSGLGIGMLPCWLGESTPGLTRVLRAEGYRQDLFLVFHRSLRGVARFRAMIEFLVKEFQRAGPKLLGE